jgi:DNA-binding transcriptional LysR family regulator
MHINETHLRLLRIFRAVVDAGGFSNAQVVLDLSPSTISTQMSQLESLLGYTLCQRGRGGFKLTDKGESLYRYTDELFDSLSTFQARANELKGGLNGHLRIGFLDNIITDNNSPLAGTLARFAKLPKNNVRLSLEVLSPSEMEHRLLDKSIDIAVGIFHNELPSLRYRPWYRERDILVCHRDHPLTRMADVSAQAREIPIVPKVVRSFLSNQEFPFKTLENGVPNATVANVEAAALLILTGVYIGFLPQHYASQWTAKDDMVELLPNKVARHSQFSLVTGTHAVSTSAILQAFMACADLERASDALV